MDKWLKLHLVKRFFNLGVRVLNLALPEKHGEHPQTAILEDVYDDMLNAYAVEAYCGRFDDVPYQSLQALKDKNFLRMLQLSKKMLLYFGDIDRYYRQWLGLFFLLIHREVQMLNDALPGSVAVDLVNREWQYELSGPWIKEFFDCHKEVAAEVVLCNHLSNLVKLTVHGGEKK